MSTKYVDSIYWFPVQDDINGGWAIATTAKPLSEIRDLGPDSDVVVVGYFINRSVANYICRLHNKFIEAVNEDPPIAIFDDPS